MSSSKNPWITHQTTEQYDNPWIRVTESAVTNPGGGEGIYGVVHFKNIAVGIVPVDAEGYTWLVGQYRYTLEQYSWEIPEGGCLKDKEVPLKAAQRELLEETGLRAQHWKEILRLHTSNSVCDEEGVAYIATGLTKGRAQPEETEELQLRRLPLSEAVEMVRRGEITDALSMIALLRAEEEIKKASSEEEA